MKKIVTGLLGCMLVLGAAGQRMPFQNASLSADKRAKDLIGRLTLTEKASLMFDQ